MAENCLLNHFGYEWLAMVHVWIYVFGESCLTIMIMFHYCSSKWSFLFKLRGEMNMFQHENQPSWCLWVKIHLPQVYKYSHPGVEIISSQIVNIGNPSFNHHLTIFNHYFTLHWRLTINQLTYLCCCTCSRQPWQFLDTSTVWAQPWDLWFTRDMLGPQTRIVVGVGVTC